MTSFAVRYSKFLILYSPLEARVGIAPTHRGFADPRLTAWLSGLGGHWSSPSLSCFTATFKSRPFFIKIRKSKIENLKLMYIPQRIHRRSIHTNLKVRVDPRHPTNMSRITHQCDGLPGFHIITRRDQQL